MAVLRVLGTLAAAAALVSAGRPLAGTEVKLAAPGETAFCTLSAFGGNVTGTLTLTENGDGAKGPADRSRTRLTFHSQATH